ncbi:MAG: hypothetical protein VB934_05460, partial [Polyangiaceae bacterium]
MRDHLLVLGWNEKAAAAIENFRSDPRHQSTDIVIVAREAHRGSRCSFLPGLPRKNERVAESLRRINPDIRISAELVDHDNREHLIHAGCDALIDDTVTIANLLVRSVQDIGVSDIVCEVLSSRVGAEGYRSKVPAAWHGKSYRDFARELIDDGISVIGVARKGENRLNPEPAFEEGGLVGGGLGFAIAR